MVYVIFVLVKLICHVLKYTSFKLLFVFVQVVVVHVHSTNIISSCTYPSVYPVHTCRDTSGNANRNRDRAEYYLSIVPTTMNFTFDL